MSYLKKLIHGEPTVMRRFHGAATVAWFVLAFPICVFLNQSLPVVVFLSVYAIVTGHWSSWQAVRVEQHADPKSPNP